ncbi:alkanesulfonate transporter permease subunit [Citrobacter koseri]|uniref:Alkanesulfonate transporter permease subunit n=1 Tax=Citrobacter koseri TaxID=545 RepID=A0A3S4IZ59_CITKO|nr:alkanesulfonate transporter permease subunit [Citrobacter koseri]
MSQPPYIRPEFERELPPLRNLPVETPLPLSQRLWNQTWLRKCLIVALVLALWEIAARIQQNDLMLPGVLQTLQAFSEDMRNGELPEKIVNSLSTLLKGYLAGSALALIASALAVTTQFGRDLLSTLTAMLNPLPAIALLPLALLWFGLGNASLIFVLIHSVMWPIALNTWSGFSSVPETLRMAGRNYGPQRATLCDHDSYSGIVARYPVRAQDRLGVRLAHVDCRRTGIWRVQRRRRPGLVYLPESQ